MSAAALDLLAEIRRHGGDVKMIAPGRLRVIAPNRMLSEIAEQVRAVKPQLLAALRSPAPDRCWWQDRYTARTFAWLVGDRDWDAARRIAWGDLQNEWHKLHGRRWPRWQCAGCDLVIGNATVLDMPDGNRVHFKPIDCCLSFGGRWRGAADEALIALGLQPPVSAGLQDQYSPGPRAADRGAVRGTGG